MKYIRTKDGKVIDVSNLELFDADEPYKGEGIGVYMGVPVIKKSDSIEELFDWVVLKLKENGRIYRLYKNLELATECEGNGILRFQILGAIETEYDLIYVAEMNDEKGEWEVL